MWNNRLWLNTVPFTLILVKGIMVAQTRGTVNSLLLCSTDSALIPAFRRLTSVG